MTEPYVPPEDTTGPTSLTPHPSPGKRQDIPKSISSPAKVRIGTGAIIGIAADGTALLCCLGTVAAVIVAGLVPSTSRSGHDAVGTSTPPRQGEQPPSGPTISRAPQPTLTASSVPPFQVFNRQDVSAGSGAKRLVVLIELHWYPVTREQVTAVAAQVVEDHRGQGWQALAIRVMYDRREIVPSFASLEWAPGGRWEDAGKGDAGTWAGYQLRTVVAQNKLTRPQDCAIPTNEAYVLNDEFNQATAAGPNVEEAVILAEIGKRHGLAASVVEQQVISVETWTLC